MNSRPTFDEGVRLCLTRDPRYPREAYGLVRDALDHAQKRLAEKDKRRAYGHLSGPEILNGFREIALAQFGPMARVVLGTWRLESTLDVGRVVFNLIEAEVFSKSENDQLSDFEGVFGFEEAFDAPFRPLAAADPAPVSPVACGAVKM
ncbi:MAG: Minf_1886 family protein [Verrucomicrobiales bacterium]